MAKKNNKSSDKRKARRRKKTKSNQLPMIIGVFVVVAILGFVLWPKTKASASRIAEDPFLGSETAAVTITEYSDFGCPSCQAWHSSGVRDRLLADYDGKVKFVYNDYPIITPQSPKAAEAAQCAYDQGKFWEYHDHMFDRSNISVSALKGYASQIGLDTDAFNSCLNSGLHKATVNHDLREGRNRGLNSTPSFIVNGTRITGQASYERLANMIDNILAAKE